MAHPGPARRRGALHRHVRRQAGPDRHGSDVRHGREGRAVDQGRQRDPLRPDRDQTIAVTGDETMTYSMKPLSCDPARINGMSERLIVSHYENNYGGAVKRLNLIDEQLAGLDYAAAPGFLVNGLKREQLIAMNSMVLHELFFDGLGDESAPGPRLRDTLARDFGSYERWRSEFMAMGRALGGGSGWVLLAWSPRDRRLVNQWAARSEEHTSELQSLRHLVCRLLLEKKKNK